MMMPNKNARLQLVERDAEKHTWKLWQSYSKRKIIVLWWSSPVRVNCAKGHHYNQDLLNVSFLKSILIYKYNMCQYFTWSVEHNCNSFELFTIQFRVSKIVNKTHFENIVGIGENAGNQHFLLLPQCFLPYQKQMSSTEPHSNYHL